MLAAAPDYVPLMAALAGEARAQGFEPRLLNHEGRSDAAVCRAIAAAAGGLDVIEPGGPLEAKGLIGAAGLVVASRFHACANALGQGVPCLGTSWSHKYAALFADFGAREWLLEQDGAPAAPGSQPAAPAASGPGDIRSRAIERLRTLVARRENVSAGLAAHRDALQWRIDSMWTQVFGLLGP
jgi:polysaccharide pyruvyl transferase WcaK-like protein